MGVFQLFSLRRDGLNARSVAAEADARAQTHRSMLAGVTATISAYWIGPGPAAAWFAFVLSHEFIPLPLVIKHLIAPNLSANPKHARRALLGITFWGCCV